MLRKHLFHNMLRSSVSGLTIRGAETGNLLGERAKPVLAVRAPAAALSKSESRPILCPLPRESSVGSEAHPDMPRRHATSCAPNPRTCVASNPRRSSRTGCVQRSDL
jgi:hypothetical protein